MTNHQITDGVGRTAIGVARARAAESRRPDRLFDDPYAAAFVAAALAGEPEPERNPQDTPIGVIVLARYLAVRTRFFDDQLLAAARAGCRQVVIPAVGLDTRALRLEWPAGTRFFEIDQPEVLAFGERVLAEQGASAAGPRAVLAGDLREDWAGVLTGAGFDPAQPSAWLLEGLLVYLSPAEVAALLTTVGSLAAPGSRLALTHGFPRSEHDPVDRTAGFAEAVPELAGVAALWQGGLDEDVAGWLERHGWRAAWHDRAEAAVSYGRPAGYLTPQRSFVTAERPAGPDRLPDADPGTGGR
ncbi:SAM-dependent methyltransferase [Kitasatospora nipponensis]